MKKLFFLIGLTLILITNVEAAPTFLPFVSTGTYTVADQSRTTNDTKTYIHYQDNGDYIYNDVATDGTLIGYAGADYSGYYIGTITNDNNDSTTDIENLIKLFLDDSAFTITAFAKADNIALTGSTISYTTESSDKDTYIDIKTYDGLLAGSWELISDNPGDAISFYSVKGSTEYALYYVDPAAVTGLWTVGHLINGGTNTPGISHFSGVIVEETPGGTNVVPEPATMLLLGFGLIGLAGIGRRNNKI